MDMGVGIPSKRNSMNKGSRTRQIQGLANSPLWLENLSDTSCDVGIKCFKLGLSQKIVGPVAAAA